jgi:two-component system, chemotaxis family, sensor kinase CheA
MTMASDPYKYFRVEARDLLDQLGSGILELEKGPATAASVARLLRLAHTLKGAARVVKAREVADRAHAIEDALAPFREGGVSLPRDCVDVVLKRLDEISAATAALAMPPATRADGSGSNLPGDAPKVLQADVQELDALLEGLVEASVPLSALRRSSANLERARRLAELLGEELGSTRNHRPLNGAAPRVRSVVAELCAIIESVQRGAVSGLEQVDRELRQVRETAERLRLIPASILFATLERAGRDAAQSLGKRVAFVAKGGDVRLDARVLSLVQNALVQAVRNAVAHGIESEADRVAAGKSVEGRLSLEVRRSENRVVFTCLDDGRGVDLEAVRRAAQRKGIRSADIQKASAQELLDLLLKGGLTTSGTANEIAGRGVGLDVVRESASRLGGEVRVQTERGTGTTIELVVPVSLSSLDALVVEAAGRTAAIPLDCVKRTIRLAPTELTQAAGGASVPFEGTVIPFSPLSRALRVGTENAPSLRPWSAVVVQAENAVCALGVDHLRGTQTVVVRPLPQLCPIDPVIAGAFLDTQGDPQLVLEPEVLVKECLRAGPLPRGVPTTPPAVLVIDDSLTTRMLEGSILESAGYEVELATSGEEGLEKARRRRFALLLVDVEMPGMDGFEVIERCQADSTLRDVPAILITSRSSPEDRLRGQRVGAVAYIAKSEFDQSELLERIRGPVRS